VTIAHRFTRGKPPFGTEVLREDSDKALQAIASSVAANDLLPFARLFGYQELPPSPGEAASWSHKDWVDWGSRNGLFVADRAKHGYQIFNPMYPDIAAYPGGSPGDVRAGMNCGADFRRSFKNGLTKRWYIFSTLGTWMYKGNLLIDKTVLSLGELLSAVNDLSPGDLETARDLGFSDPASTTDVKVEVPVGAVYNAISYLARGGEQQCTYADVLLRAAKAAGVPLGGVDEATRLIKTISDLKRQGDPVFQAPAATSLLYRSLLESSEEAKEAKAAERDAKRASRAADKAAKAAAKNVTSVKTPLERFGEELSGVKTATLEQLTRFEHDITQMRSRHDKVVEFVENLKLPVPTEIIQENQELQRKLEEALLENDALQESLDSAKEDADARVQELRGTLENFASTVYTKLVVKDFLEIAQGIRDLLPMAEKFALGDIEENKPQEAKAQ
jgi:hypothetical protein